MGPRTDLERAIAQRLSEGLSYQIDVGEIDCDASFFDPTGYTFGGYTLDSLDIVEMLVTLEVDLGVPIVTQSDVTQFSSIAKLGALITRTVEPEVRSSFEATWAKQAH